MPTDQRIADDVASVAEKYIGRSIPELDKLFLKEWGAVKPSAPVPVRGDSKEFWDGVKQRFVAKLVKNQTAASVTIGFVTAQVVTWAQTAGIDLTAYRIPIGILVALITQAVWEQLEASSKN